jgi:hypothetical protein
MLSHFFSAFFNNTTQQITPFTKIIVNIKVIFSHNWLFDVHIFFWNWKTKTAYAIVSCRLR